MDFLLNLAASGPTNGPGMFLENWLVLMYLGPETIMPLASILAAVLRIPANLLALHCELNKENFQALER